MLPIADVSLAEDARGGSTVAIPELELLKEETETISRGLLERVDGSDIPFFELSELGGDETLRGFGDNRFLDEGRVLFNAEERIKVYQITYGDVRTDIELAVFTDVGRVFHNFNDLGSGKIQNRRRGRERGSHRLHRAGLSLLSV